MVLVILAIGLIILITGILLCHKSYTYDELGFGLGVVGGIISIVATIVLIALLVSVSELPVIQDKIDMYNEENANIESQIDTIVKTYMEHEKEIFVNTTSESSMTLISLYPELKSDVLIQKQLEIYTNNNEMIKSLKEEQIHGSIYKWWLYFGK